MAIRNSGKTEDQIQLHRYQLAGGWIVLAGKTNTDNDLLSLKLSHPNDWWFHIKGMSGSHVILRAMENQEPEKEILRQAAAIAAYHSKARNAGVVPVSVTRAKFVSKPRGAKPGTVQIRRESVFKVKPGLPESEI